MESVVNVMEMSGGGRGYGSDERLDSGSWALIEKVTGPLDGELKDKKNRFQLIDVEALVKCFNHLSNRGFSRSQILELIKFKDRTFAGRMADGGYKFNSRTRVFYLDDLSRVSNKVFNKGLNEGSEEEVLENDFVAKSLLKTVSSTVVSDSVGSDSTSRDKMIEKLGMLENEVFNSNRIGFDLEKHLLEQSNILLQQRLLLIEQQEVLIKEIREVNAKIDLSPFSVISNKLDGMLDSTAPSISSDFVDYSDWLRIKFLPPYDDSDKTFTRSFYIHPTVLEVFKHSYLGRTTQKIAINEAMLLYSMKVPELSKKIQRFLRSPDELHSLVEFDSNLDE